MEIGNANYDKKSKTNIGKIKDGDHIFRILPPLGTFAKDGKWFTYKAVEWGYKDTKGNNRPFQDVRKVNFKTKMVEVESAAHLKREQIAKQYDQALAMFKSGQLTKDDMEKVKSVKQQFNLEKKYYVNAINQKGELILQKIGYKAMKALEVEIKKLRDQGIDPLSVDNGRFFNIFRSGDGFDTSFSVSVVSENINVPDVGIVQKQIKHVLDESILKRLATEAKDLSELDKMYPIVTAAQVERIVTGGPAGVDEVLGVREENGAQAVGDDGAEDEAPAQSAAASTPAPESKAEQKAETPAPEAKKEEPAPSTPAPGQAAATQDKSAFLASLGIN